MSNIKKTPIREINTITQTNRKGYEKYLDYAANYIVKLALILNINATQLTVAWIIIQTLSTFLLFFGNYYLSLVGLIIFQLMFIVDLSDGKLARLKSHYKKKQSKKKLILPKFLDKIGHFLNDSFLFIALGIGVYIKINDIIYVLIGFSIAFVFLLNKSLNLNPSWYKHEEQRTKILELYNQTHPRSKPSRLNIFIFDILRVEHLFSLIFFGFLFSLHKEMLIIYFILFSLELIRKIIKEIKLLYNADKAK